ncbi:hypothetical protein FB567DRAFT_533056 [Paraphoma chrysanthemicola]|uniref:Uncharacterized protein n=1 Tax=Paraphoma chrysanthemicola TaxID=798071 RepID=A0A8K0R1S0_9PLEO|nr:hypothetical protein FB567DRAFT_533056 [Paraphoma chrysanthemicola]
MCIPSATENPYRPPTPGLLLTNRQIYGEAVEILYSVNVLRFNDPGQLFAFEQRVGRENCTRVNKISIWVRIPRRDENVADPALLLRDEYDSVPTHWVAALDACGLRSVRQLGVEAEAIGGQPTSLLTMPTELKECIGRFLTRAEGNGVPRLMLTGFKEEVENEFPPNWEVEMDQWDSYKEEMEGFRQETEEHENYLRENGARKMNT